MFEHGAEAIQRVKQVSAPNEAGTTEVHEQKDVPRAEGWPPSLAHTAHEN